MERSHSNRIAAFRRGAELTQQQLADEIGASRVSVNRWERGQQEPTLHQAIQLAEALHTSLDDLFGEPEEVQARRGNGTRHASPRPRRRSESGKRLWKLHAQKRGGRTMTDLWELQVAVAKAVSALEYFDLPELDWSEENEALVAEIYDDLERHLRWNEAALDTVVAHMGELGRQRKIKVLEARSNDPSSTLNEREVAARLAERLRAKAGAARLST